LAKISFRLLFGREVMWPSFKLETYSLK
jgi:hypothetical protein